MKSRTPEKVFAIYLFIFYFIPALAYASGFRVTFYNYPGLTLAETLYICLIMLALIGALIFERLTRRDRVIRGAPVQRKARWVVLVVVLSISTYGYLSDMSGWRYAENNISDQISIGKLAYIALPPIIEFLIFRELFFADIHRSHRQAARLRGFVLGVSAALCASGIGPMLLATIALAFSFFPEQFRRGIFFRQACGPVPRTWPITFLVSVPMVFLLMVTAILGGEIIKTGSDLDAVLDVYSDMSFEGIALYLIGRFSTAWVSLINSVGHVSVYSVSELADNFFTPLQNFLYRLDTVTGGWLAVSRPSPGTLSRINYEMITAVALNDREGTSPGLLAAFVLTTPIIFCVVAICIYVGIVARLLARAAAIMPGKLTWLGCAGLAYFFSIFFSSPIDLMLIFDQSAISVLAICIFIYRSTQSRRLSNAHQ